MNLAWLPLVGAASEIAHIHLERRAERAHVAREEARRRASEERLLIARELHDVLAHNISLINVQSGVALHLLDERSGQARPPWRPSTRRARRRSRSWGWCSTC